MSVLPNAVGRLDDVVMAIRCSEYCEVELLLADEIKRLQYMVRVAGDEYRKRSESLGLVMDFKQKYECSAEFRNECEVECNV